MPQGMEPDTKKYLLKVLNSLFAGMIWLSLNVLSGLYWGYAIIGKKMSVSNFCFFVWFALSLLALLYYYYRTWKNG
jgi:hypothetical protein